MAMYVVLYGFQRIRFFYQLLFYFDYVTAPAIILLPLWIANEFLQYWFDSSSHVAHMAHAGGLFTGAILAWVYKRRHPDATVREIQAPADTAKADRMRADALLKALRMDEARAACGALAAKGAARCGTRVSIFQPRAIGPRQRGFPSGCRDDIRVEGQRCDRRSTCARDFRDLPCERQAIGPFVIDSDCAPVPPVCTARQFA